MKGQIFTVNSRKYDFSLRRSWSARLLERPEDGILLEGFFEEEVSHADLGLIVKNTRSVETFFLDRWYNYFVFYEPTGALRNYYINISMPPKIDNGVVDYVDLDIDVIVWPDSRIEILDLEEFEENSRSFGYAPDVIETAIRTGEEIVRAPFRYISPILSAT